MIIISFQNISKTILVSRMLLINGNVYMPHILRFRWIVVRFVLVLPHPASLAFSFTVFNIVICNTVMLCAFITIRY